MAESTRSTLQRWIIVMIALLAPMLGGSTQRWSQGVVLGLLAAAVFMKPPVAFIGRVFAGAAAAGLALGAIAWVPASFWGETWWRRILVQELGLTLPSTFSVQPWLSADAFILLASGMLWLLLLGAREWTNSERRWMARKVCGGLMVLTLAWLIVHYAGWHVPIWVCDRNFGPFPNRNQTGDLLATWSVVAAACAVEDFRRGRWVGGWWIAGTVLFLWGLIVNYSRAGVLLFFLGLVGWGILQLAKTPSLRSLIIGFAVVLVLASVFFLFGGSTLERFTDSKAFFPDPIQDYRALVFRDAWHMGAKSPWCGAGLGNFEGMFAMARLESANNVRLLHPESDWLWLLNEMGLFGPLLAMTLAGVFVRRAFPLERKSSPILRSAALVGALLFLIHGFFDVSGHRLGSAIPGLMLLGLAARIPWTAAPDPMQPWIARIAAAVLGFIGIGWIVATAEGWVWPGSIGVKVLNVRARATNEREHFDETIKVADRAIQLAVLDWENYFLRGVAYLYSEKLLEAELDFRRARRLEPSIASAPYEEGRMWIYFDPARAMDAWAEALRREPAQNVSYFRRMLADVGSRPRFRMMLRELVSDRTDLLLEWLSTSSPDEFRIELERLIANEDFSKWTPAHLGMLFDAWLKSGDISELIQWVEASPTRYAAGWRQLANAYAAKKDFQRACQTIRRSQPSPVLPDLPERSEEDAAREFARSPRDFISGYQLYRARTRSGDWNGALAALDRLAGLTDAPPFIASLRTDALEHLERWPEAWAALSKTTAIP